MVENLRVTGGITKWKAEEYLLGLITENMKVNILMTRKKDMEYFSGLMEGDMMEHGKMENSMEKENIPQHLVKQKEDNGPKEKELLGSDSLIFSNSYFKYSIPKDIIYYLAWIIIKILLLLFLSLLIYSFVKLWGFGVLG